MRVVRLSVFTCQKIVAESVHINTILIFLYYTSYIFISILDIRNIAFHSFMVVSLVVYIFLSHKQQHFLVIFFFFVFAFLYLKIHFFFKILLVMQSCWFQVYMKYLCHRKYTVFHSIFCSLKTLNQFIALSILCVHEGIIFTNFFSFCYTPQFIAIFLFVIHISSQLFFLFYSNGFGLFDIHIRSSKHLDILVH